MLRQDGGRDLNFVTLKHPRARITSKTSHSVFYKHQRAGNFLHSSFYSLTSAPQTMCARRVSSHRTFPYCNLWQSRQWHIGGAMQTTSRPRGDQTRYSSCTRDNLPWRTRSGHPQRILVFFVSIDSHNMTGLALDPFNNLRRDDFTLDMVLGAQALYVASIRAVAQGRNNVILHDLLPSLVTISCLAPPPSLARVGHSFAGSLQPKKLQAT